MTERFRSLPVALTVLACGGLAGCSLVERRTVPSQTPPPTESPTASPLPTPSSTLESTITPTVIASPTPIPDFYTFENISLRPGDTPLNIQIRMPNSEDVFDIEGQPVLFTQDHCDKGRGGSFEPVLRTTCEYIYATHGEDGDIAHFVHTGVDWGGQPHPAEGIRNFIEGINYANLTASLSPEERDIRMSTLEGSLVTISRGELSIDNLRVLEVVRIPPAEVPAFTRSVESTIHLATATEPDIARFVGNGQKEIFIIICGITTPGEEAPPGVGPYDWSRYIIVIGREEADESIVPFLTLIPGALIGQKKDFVIVSKNLLRKKKGRKNKKPA